MTWDRAPEAESSQGPRSVDRAGGGVLSRSSICVTTSGRVLVIGWSRRTYSRALRSRKPPASVGGGCPVSVWATVTAKAYSVAFGGSLRSVVAELGCCVGIGAARDAGRVGESGKAEIDQDGSAACLDDDVWRAWTSPWATAIALECDHRSASRRARRQRCGACATAPQPSRRDAHRSIPAACNLLHRSITTVAVDAVRLRCGTSAMHGRPVEKVDDAHQPGVGQAFQQIAELVPVLVARCGGCPTEDLDRDLAAAAGGQWQLGAPDLALAAAPGAARCSVYVSGALIGADPEGSSDDRVLSLQDVGCSSPIRRVDCVTSTQLQGRSCSVKVALRVLTEGNILWISSTRARQHGSGAPSSPASHGFPTRVSRCSPGLSPAAGPRSGAITPAIRDD